MTNHLWAITSSACAGSGTQAWFSTLCSNLNVAHLSHFRAILLCYQLLQYHRVLPVTGRLLVIANAMCFPLQQGFSTSVLLTFCIAYFFFFFRSCPVYYRMFSSTLASSHQMPGTFLCLWQQKLSPDVVKWSPGGGDWTVKLSRLRTSERFPRFHNIRKIRFPTQRQNDEYKTAS